MENKIYFLIVFPLLISFLILFFFIYPKFQNLKFLEKEIYQKSFEVQNFHEYSKKLKEISNQLNERKEDLSKIDSALPSELSLPELFHFLRNSAFQSGLSFSRIVSVYSGSNKENPPTGEMSSFTKENKSNTLKETKIHFILTGNYQAFKNFLSTIEKSARLIEVEQISFSTPKKEEIFDFNLIIKVYSY